MHQLTTRKLLIDDSLSLINRTGAHFIARDLVHEFGHLGSIRRWRRWGVDMPPDLTRKILGKLMLKELKILHSLDFWQWPEPKQAATKLFLDPLYVLRSRLDEHDLVLCHDIGPISHPDLYEPDTIALYQRAYAKVRQAKPGVVFVSHTSQRAFEQAFGTDYRHMETIPLYVRTAAVGGESKPIVAAGDKFFLSVGALERRKNHRTTIEAFKASGLGNQGYKLVICGSRGDAGDEIKALAEATANVVLLGYVDDTELRWLYQNAQAFVLPSRLEGFGMPVLEAARYGLPAIVSKDSALNEAVGQLGLPVSHDSVSELTPALHAVTQMSLEDRSQMRARLTAHAAEFSRERFIDHWRDLLTRELSIPTQQTIAAMHGQQREQAQSALATAKT